MLLQPPPPTAKDSKPQSGSAPHSIEMPDGRWAVWRHVALRGAGFPASQVLKLSLPEQAAAVEHQSLLLERAQDEAQRAQKEAVEAARAWAERAAPEQRAGAERLLNDLRNGRVPKAKTRIADASTRAAVEALREALRGIEAAQERFEQSFDACVRQGTRAVAEIASQKRFREALIWQNRQVYRTAVQPFLRHAAANDARGFKQRQREELIANYCQRYCVKNDTIGFFGPVGWAKLKPEGEAIVVRPGAELLAARNVRFEAWCLDSLVEALAREGDFAPWLSPRRMPLVDIEGTTLHLPTGGAVKVSAECAALLQACDGARNAKQLAADLLRTPAFRLKSESDIYRLLTELRNKSLVFWDWIMPLPFQLHPAATLGKILGGIEDDPLRERSLRALTELDAARRAVECAGGEPEKLDEALGELDATFTRLTGVPATRSHGNTYAARTIVYEDCRRDVEVEFGPELLHSLGSSLTLLLEGARWFSYEFSLRMKDVMQKIYAGLARQAGSSVVEGVAFYEKLRPLIFTPESVVQKSVLTNFHRRWADVLSFSPQKQQQRRLHYTSEELRPRVLAAFDAPRAGWPYARFHSPDVMIAAPSAEAIRRGDYLFVLSELHPVGVTLSNWIFVGQHAAPEELYRAIESDLPEARVLLIAPKHQPGALARTSVSLVTPKDYFLEYSLESAHFAPGRTIPLGSIVFENRDGGMIARTRDGRVSYDAIEFLGSVLTTISGGDLKIMPRARHTPRVTIDRLVVTRETWLFAPSEISFADEKDEARRFVAARRWARRQGLPRFVFVKTPAEVKPFFVDFESPILINLFARMVHRTLSGHHTDPLVSIPTNPLITVSEMLPTPEQVWLPDAEGQHYTSELRMVFVDMLDKRSRFGASHGPA